MGLLWVMITLSQDQLVKFKQLAKDFYSNLITHSDMQKGIGFSEPTVNRLLKDHGLWQKKTQHTKSYPYDEAFFETIDTEEKAYFLGFVMADGCVYIGKKGDRMLRVEIHKKDREILEKFAKALKTLRPLKYRKDYVDIRVFGRKILKDLKRLGCVQRKSLILKFPDSTQVPDHLIHHLVRGYFDGDGTVCYGKRTGSHYYWIKLAIYCSHFFAKKLCNLLNNEGIYTVKTKKGSIAEVRVVGFTTTKLAYDYIYKDSSIWLKRKRDKFHEGWKYSPRHGENLSTVI